MPCKEQLTILVVFHFTKDNYSYSWKRCIKKWENHQKLNLGAYFNEQMPLMTPWSRHPSKVLLQPYHSTLTWNHADCACNSSANSWRLMVKSQRAFFWSFLKRPPLSKWKAVLCGKQRRVCWLYMHVFFNKKTTTESASSSNVLLLHFILWRFVPNTLNSTSLNQMACNFYSYILNLTLSSSKPKFRKGKQPTENAAQNYCLNLIPFNCFHF